MKTELVFQRQEQKYLLQPRQAAALFSALLPFLQPDAYGRHTICSLYFDTADLAAAQAHLDKTGYREKLRLRSYGVPSAADTVFLELKKKLDGTTYKRRAALPLAEARAYLRQGTPPRAAGQVFGEIDWFCRRHAPVPQAVVCYDRVALTTPLAPGLRLTFDQNIRWRATALDLAKGDWGSPLCPRGEVLLEVKSPGPLPLWLARVLGEHKAYPASFSKYLRTAQAMQSKEVPACAG